MRALFWLKEWARDPRSFDRGLLGLDGATPGAVRALAERKLARLLRAAVQDVPFYRQLAAEGKIDAEHPRLEQFPILGKGDIRGREEWFVSDRYRVARLSMCRTSGSTGEPFKFYRDPREFTPTYVDLWRGLARLGIRRGDRRALVKGVDETPGASLATRVRRWAYGVANQCVVIDAHFLARSEANVRGALVRLRRYRPVYLHGYVSSIDLLAVSAERWGVRMDDVGIRAVVTESEKLYDFQRERIGRVFGCRVAENYGSVEFGMIAGAAVLTNLDAYAFPFIRFKNGDCLTLRAEKRSSLPYREIERVDGRVADTIHLPDGGRLQGFIVMYPVSKHMRYIQAYQVRQTRPEELEVLVVPLAGESLPETIRAQIVAEMRAIVGVDVAVHVREVAEIPLTQRGKRRFVVSQLEGTK